MIILDEIKEIKKQLLELKKQLLELKEEPTEPIDDVINVISGPEKAAIKKQIKEIESQIEKCPIKMDAIKFYADRLEEIRLHFLEYQTRINILEQSINKIAGILVKILNVMTEWNH